MPRRVRPFVFASIVLLAVAPVLAQQPGEDAPAAAPAAAPPVAPAEAPRIVLTPEAEAQLSAADRERADNLEREANTLFRDGRYKEAIEKFRQAHEISQNVDILYSIAVSYQQLEAWQECVSFMERYLEKAPVGPKRDRAENTRTSCDARIERDQQLIIDSDPPGAAVFLDDRDRGQVGTTPFRTYVRPGTHTVWVELQGYEPVLQNIDVQQKEPFRMNLAMRQVQNQGWLFVDASIVNARVYIDGKNVGLTPFKEPVGYSAGRHQVVVERDGYTRFTEHVEVKKGQVTTVNAYLVRTVTPTSWRSGVGWTSAVLGALGIAGGIVAWQFADEEFNDTDDFEQLALYEKLGYGIGGGLMALGVSFVIWDNVRDVIDDEDKNPDYQKTVAPPPPTPSVTFIPSVGPRGFSFGFRF